MTKPVHGTHEWASSNVNCIRGCKNNCRYCYAKTAAVKSGSKTLENWHIEEVNNKVIEKNYRKRDGTVMFPTTHDISEENLDSCLIVLEKLLKVGNKVLIVSKPHINCISKLCVKLEQYKDNILFRFTIGSPLDKILKFWEPGAPSYMERLASLVLAYKSGFQTSVSCEPYLCGNILKVVEETEPYVTDSIWIGKANKLTYRLKMNGADGDALNYGRMLEKFQCDENVMKLYHRLEDNPKVKWKDSIKTVVGLQRPTEKGLDV